MLTADQIRERVAELGPWFHNLRLNGVETAPNHFLGNYPEMKFAGFAHVLPADLRGASVLDIGCNGGFYSIEMKRRGADRVVAIDSDAVYLKQARFAANVCGVEIEFRHMDVYQIAELGEKFDLVLFMGVLYHLRHPLLALDLLHGHAVKNKMLFQSMLRGSGEVAALESDYPFAERGVFEREGFPAMYFVEERYSGDPTNWWVPNRACAEAMLRSAGFRIEAHPEPEVYLCGRA